MKKELSHYQNLIIIYDSVNDFKTNNQEIKGVFIGNKLIECRSLIITTGTFLNGKMYVGKEKKGGGRSDENPSISIAISIKKLKLNMGRLKTRTPPMFSV